MGIKKYFLIGKNTLYHINRSITGKGTKKTLQIIKKEFPNLKIKRVKSRTKVFDWIVPDEWNVKKAFVEDKFGKKIIDIKNNNLHLISYATPIKKKVTKKELLKNLHSLKNKPNAIPYITSYYKKRWGFCIADNQKKRIIKDYNSNDYFKVFIDTSFNSSGNLYYGELIIKGKSKKEILISTYICHPSMANNELSGPIVSMGLINYFKDKKNLQKTLKFIFIPETIGSICFISKNFEYLKKNFIGGYNLSCIGDDRMHSCMLSKVENAPSDESLIEAYEKLKIKKFKIFSFLKRGSDERQFNSPGVNLNITSIFRSKYGEYPEYHTSLDNFKLVTFKGILGGFRVAKKAIEILLKKIIPKNLIICEPNMGKRGLYPTLSTTKSKPNTQKLMDFLQYADGQTSLEKIAKTINLNFKNTKKIYIKLKKNNLID